MKTFSTSSTSQSLSQGSSECKPAAPTGTPIERTMQRVNYERKAASQQGVEFKLDTVRLMLHRLGDPHQRLKIVHIAGTKGKGSTASFVSHLGAACGLKTGVYSSPHFESYTERFQINNLEVDEDTLNPFLERVLAVAEELDAEIDKGESALNPATFFDISTVTALLLFAEQKVDLVALEVGLGGRLDSTNVCDAAVSIITNISLDHTKQLGGTKELIAGEKAGIIKTSAPVICGPVDESVAEVIRNKANEHAAPVFRFGQEFLATSIELDPEEAVANESVAKFSFADAEAGLVIPDIRLHVLGPHQISNACLALAAIARLIPQLPLDNELDLQQALRLGIEQTTLTGRLEVVARSPWIITDMAHNEASIEAMVTSLRSLAVSGEQQVVFSCSRDKDYSAMLRKLWRQFDHIILTEFQNNPRCCPLEVLEAELKKVADEDATDDYGTGAPNVENLSTTYETLSSPVAAFQKALNKTSTNGLIVICGSIFLVGDLMPSIRKILAEK